jgi:hypothetical protein
MFSFVRVVMSADSLVSTYSRRGRPIDRRARAEMAPTAPDPVKELIVRCWDNEPKRNTTACFYYFIDA